MTNRSLVFMIAFFVVLGGFYFYQTRLIPSPATPYKPSITDRLSGLDSTSSQPKFIENNTASFFAFIDRLPFLSLELQPSLFIEEDTDQVRKDGLSHQLTEEEQQRQIAIRNYLITSSDIEFISDPALLLEALNEAKEGNFSKIEVVQNTFSENLVHLKALSPPKEMGAIHDKSVEIVERYIALMDDTIQKKDTVEQLWSSDTLKIILKDSAKTKEEIKTMIFFYQIVLPPGVIL